MKLPPRHFNPGPYPPHLTNTFTCGVIIAPRMCDEIIFTLGDLFIASLVYCELKFAINMKVIISICIVNFFLSCLVVFSFKLKDFPRKIWYSCAIVFLLYILKFLLP